MAGSPKLCSQDSFRTGTKSSELFRVLEEVEDWTIYLGLPQRAHPMRKSSDEEVMEVKISSPRSSKKRRSHRSSGNSISDASLDPEDQARNEDLRASKSKSKKNHSRRSSRHLVEHISSDANEREVVRARHRSSKQRRSHRSSRYSAEEANQRASHRSSKIVHEHRSSRHLVGMPTDEEENEVVTTTSKTTRRSRRSSAAQIRDNCRLMVGACICTFGIFVAVVVVILTLQRQNRVPYEGLIAQVPPAAAQHYSPTTKEPTPSPTRERTISPAPSTTFVPSESPSFQPSTYPTTAPSVFPSEAPSVKPTVVPSVAPSTPVPTKSPTPKPSPAPTTTFRPTTPAVYPQTVVLQSRQFLERGEFVSSPSREYRVGLSTIGEFVLLDSDENEVWKPDATGAEDLFLQGDGNLVMRDANGDGLWSTKTSTSSASLFILDDGGIIGLLQTFRGAPNESTYVWMKGVPRGKYYGQPRGSTISYPIRGAFYYPWFPETWTAGGKRARFATDLGWYHSGDPSVVRKHIEELEYGRIDLGIISWFGIDSNNDIARITQMLEQTEASNSPLKWAIYYEMFDKVRTIQDIRRDLEYIKRWYCWYPSYAHIDERPVIFIYQSRGCDIIQNWVDASQGEWYLVPKIFVGYGACSAQLNPGKYHQYAPAQAVEQYDGLAFTISPGFWKANEDEPRLARLDTSAWCQNVRSMVNSNAPWQLVTTFNEAGEGTIIEPSRVHWPSASGYGIYLDCLHDIY